MGSLRILTTVFAIASTIVAKEDCFAKLGLSFASVSPCGDKEALAHYLSKLQDHDDQWAIASYYINSGCSHEDATYQSELILHHSREHCVNKELRRVKRKDDTASSTDDSSKAASSSTVSSAATDSSAKSTRSTKKSTLDSSTSKTDSATTTTSTTASSTTSSTSTDSSATSSHTTFKSGEVNTGTVCFTTSNKSTSECDVQTSKGHVKTQTCTPTEVRESSCAPNLICTINPSKEDICMEIGRIQTDGIVIAVIFLVATFAIFGAICFASMRDSRRQKAAAERAEATALLRKFSKRNPASAAAL
ncbi:hypothetical protein BGZ63DRAFT_440383 [Mariannaea sp. PMI_226]|nr:hypothetical protein BGZ63DRAFT_440383 [Mariannaea sp. PMI_226]